MQLSFYFAGFGSLSLWRSVSSARLASHVITVQTSSNSARHRYASSHVRPSPRSPKYRRPRGMAVNPAPGSSHLLTDPNQGQQLARRGSLVRFLRPTGQVSDLKRLKRERISPPAALAHWLDTQTGWERDLYWRSIKKHISPSSLPNILLEHLHRSKYPETPTDVGESFYGEATTTLQKRGMALEDVDKWAWIVSGQSVDEMAERFLSTDCAKPPFLLLEILRRDVLQVKNLKLLLSWTWYQLAGMPQPHSGVLSQPKLDSLTMPPSDEVSRSENATAPLKLEDTTSIMIISRLLYQARRIWPPAIVSVSHMAALVIRSIPDSKGEEPAPVEPRMHHRLCKIHNQILRLLALPASINPLKSMNHNWQGQRVLIEMIAQFNPPLILDQDSYRAVTQVLAASKKSERESRVANLRARSWPPWRIEQDGMDAQRSPEDDLSRVISAGMRAKEAGYAGSVEDQVMRIFGGQEADGTPTIQTRKLIKRRSRPLQQETQPESDPNLWAARIEATRDIQEAWGAFKNFEDQDGNANQRMYLAMFEKLNFNEAIPREKAPYSASPGDGKEVLVPSNDNMSAFYQRRLTPPSFDELYDKMILRGTQPTGRLLTFLLGHAQTLERGIQYVRESQLNSQAVAFLAGNGEIPPAVLNKVPAPTFAAFIKFLCRFAPRAVVTERPTSAASDPDKDYQDTEFAPVKHEYHILEPRTYTGEPVTNTLHRSMELLKASQTRFRPAWYALFEALARRHTVIDRGLRGDPRNDLLSWQVLFAALGDFHRCGLELDPQGFLIICHGLEKAVLASFDVSPADKTATFMKCPETLITDEFLKLSGTGDIHTPYTPELLHSIDGVHLHAYLRVLGLLDDYKGILRVLEWMAAHHEVLEGVATRSRNGRQLIRRVLVATRAFLDDTSYEPEAVNLVESVESWGGWPQEQEAQKYLELWPGQPTEEDPEMVD